MEPPADTTLELSANEFCLKQVSWPTGKNLHLDKVYMDDVQDSHVLELKIHKEKREKT